MIRYTDDIAELAENEQELEATLENMGTTIVVSRYNMYQYNMIINKAKSKIMVVRKHDTRANC